VVDLVLVIGILGCLAMLLFVLVALAIADPSSCAISMVFWGGVIAAAVRRVRRRSPR
jgi:hypothetical protein